MKTLFLKIILLLNTSNLFALKKCRSWHWKILMQTLPMKQSFSLHHSDKSVTRLHQIQVRAKQQYSNLDKNVLLQFHKCKLHDIYLKAFENVSRSCIFIDILNYILNRREDEIFFYLFFFAVEPTTNLAQPAQHCCNCTFWGFLLFFPRIPATVTPAFTLLWFWQHIQLMLDLGIY